MSAGKEYEVGNTSKVAELGYLGRHCISEVTLSPDFQVIIFQMQCGLEIKRNFDPTKRSSFDTKKWVGAWLYLTGSSLVANTKVLIHLSRRPPEEF